MLYFQELIPHSTKVFEVTAKMQCFETTEMAALLPEAAFQPTFVLLSTEHKFNVQIYMNFDKVGGKGVILYVCQDGKKLAVCCNNRLEVHPEEMVSIRCCLQSIWLVASGLKLGGFCFGATFVSNSAKRKL